MRDPGGAGPPGEGFAPPSAEDSSPDPCWIKACDLLARRPHFRAELEAKLAQRGFEAEAVARACDRLERDGYLNDLECARSLVEGSLGRKGYGPLRVRAELARRGAAEGVVDEIVAPLFGEAEEERALEVAERWRARHRAEPERLARHLERKGFTRGAIRRAVDETRRAEAG